MFGGQHRIDEAETARAGWGETNGRRQPQRRDSRAMGQVCSWTEKIRIKSLETVGVVRDNAVIGHMELRAKAGVPECDLPDTGPSLSLMNRNRGSIVKLLDH